MSHLAQPTQPLERSPADGPQIVFLSGGTALRGLCRALTKQTHRSVHVVTPFDSGGSSSKLRAHFSIPAVGDLRNRLLSLCDDGSPDAAANVALLGGRLDETDHATSHRALLHSLVSGAHPLARAAPEAVRALTARYLQRFLDAADDHFDFAGASIGNLVLIGAMFEHGGLPSAIDAVAERIGAQGIVRPTAPGSYHLAARLRDGQTVVGQHRITGKETAPLCAAVEDLWLVADLKGTPCSPPTAAADTCALIQSADLICLPIGSFWTSVAANLLPLGIASAIAAARCPKVFVPNTIEDPEQLGMTVAALTRALLAIARRTVAEEISDLMLIDTVLLDSRDGQYPGGVDLKGLAALGVRVARAPLTDENGRIAGANLATALMRLVRS